MLTGISNNNFSTARGYIYIPDDVDRDTFVKTAFRTERVSVLLEDSGALVNEVYIDKSVLQEIYFPTEYQAMGSCVSCINIFPQNEFIIVGVLSKSDDSQFLDEYEFRKERRSETGLVSISGKGKNGELYVNIDSKNSNGGKLIVNIRNTENSGEMQLNIKGDVNVYTEGNISLKATESISTTIVNHDTKKESTLSYKNSEGFTYEDEFGNKITTQSNGTIQIEPSGTLKVGTGAEKTLKGESTVAELNKCTARIDSIINAINNAPVGSADGGATFKTSLITALSALTKEDYSGVLSDKMLSD